jgi:hypothetical protein
MIALDEMGRKAITARGTPPPQAWGLPAPAEDTTGSNGTARNHCDTDLFLVRPLDEGSQTF